MRDIIFATKNKDKIKEIKAVLGDKYNILSMEDAGVSDDIEENGTTFEENALIKAEFVMKKTGKLVLADDSGLEIDYFDKKPGVYSARFMGKDTPYSEKNRQILQKMEGVPEEKRSARFVCAIACAMPEGGSFTVRETIEGIIGYEIKGENGFGYDPIFFVPELNKTTAELTMEEKNKISHRGKALVLMREQLEKI